MATAAQIPVRPHRLDASSSRVLWRRWVAANAAGEFVGLGLTGLAAAMIVWALDPRWPALAAGALVASGAIEGTVVGVAQWRVLRGRIAVTAGRWITATVVGAVAAWAAGVTPMLLAPQQEGAVGAEPSVALQLALAAPLGMIAGAVLGGPQAWVLRGTVPRPWRWLAANAGAWAVALPVTFVAPSLMPQDASALALSVAFAVGALVAGAVAGAIHGIVLVTLARGPLAVRHATAVRRHVGGDRHAPK